MNWISRTTNGENFLLLARMSENLDWKQILAKYHAGNEDNVHGCNYRERA